MSYATTNPVGAQKRIIIGLRNFDIAFKSRVYTLMGLNERNATHYQVWMELMREVCYQVVDCITLNETSYLQLLNYLPHMETIPHFPKENPELVRHFSDAVKEFGVQVGFAFQPYWDLNKNHDIIFSHYDEGMLCLTLFQRGLIYGLDT